MQDSTLLIVRGILSLLAGIAAMAWPSVTLAVLVALFAAYAFLDGVVSLVLAFTRTASLARPWTQVLLGIAGIAAGVITFMSPRLTLLGLLLFIAGWAIVRGVLDVVAAAELRKATSGEWPLAFAGVMSIIFGVIVFAFPGASALTIAWLLGAYAVIWGASLIGLGIRLRRPLPA